MRQTICHEIDLTVDDLTVEGQRKFLRMYELASDRSISLWTVAWPEVIATLHVDELPEVDFDD
jgi:hypothetical protein